MGSMDTTGKHLWSAFLHASPPEMQRALLGCLSTELVHELQHTPRCSINFARKGFEPIEEELAHIHFSWLIPFLRTLSENEVKIFLSCLTPEQMKGLKQALLLSNVLPTPTPLGKTYLKQKLFEEIAQPDLLPLYCLPDDPLNILLELSPDELSSLIDLLSMHDLSIEIRHIIETTKLKDIHALLSKPQLTFLKTLLHRKEPVSFKKIGLINWKGDIDALRSMLVQRGINRIAKALYEHSPSLLWHVAHRLDAEKGQLLFKLCTALDHPRASLILGDQVIELVNALKTINPA